VTHRPEDVTRALQLRRLGHSTAEVARRLQIPRGTVRDWVNGRVPAIAAAGSRACEGCGGLEHAFHELPRPYVYLLGLYLGDGCISDHRRSVYKLRISLDSAYPGIVAAAKSAMEAVLPQHQTTAVVHRGGWIEVYAYWKGWPCLFPQAGPGRKHERHIALAPWQEWLAEQHPHELLRGLIHSDGCRFINTGTNWVNPRYSFSNRSDDIRGIFSAACERLGVRWTACPNTIYVSRKDDVARLDEFIGPKA
jgi:hypothetical protein